MKQFVSLITAGVVTGLLFTAGCRHSPRAGSTGLQIEASGDPGVEAHVVAKQNGSVVCDTNLIAPAAVNCGSGDLDVTCTPAGKPGHLRIRALISDSETAMDANEAGTVLQIKVRAHLIEGTTTGPGGTAVSRASF